VESKAMSLYTKIDTELLVAFESFAQGTMSVGSLVSLLQSSILVIESIDDKEFRNAIKMAEGEIDVLIASKFGEDGFKEMYCMYNDCLIFDSIIEIIASLKTYLNE
jgi:hypothetical protein